MYKFGKEAVDFLANLLLGAFYLLWHLKPISGKLVKKSIS